jgi:hypothetical protein
MIHKQQLGYNESDIIGDVPDDFFVNAETLEEAVQKEIEGMVG